MTQGKSPATIRGNGLHCVYGQCEGFPNSNRECHPGCSFHIGVPLAIMAVDDGVCRHPIVPSWWFEQGERDEADTLAKRIRSFLADARLISPDTRRLLSDAATAMEVHRGG